MRKSSYLCTPKKRTYMTHNYTEDERYMLRCLQLAERGLGRVKPNPMVGCVIVQEGEIIAEGYHQRHGEWHAERNAILHCRQPERLEGSTLYCNLEPCSHHGLTPPCATLIVERRIGRVVVCNDDPNPQVDGRGYRLLEEAGIEVVRHVLEEKGRWLNRRFFTFQEQRRPYIILKWAQSADGYMAPDFQPYWITRPALQALSHKWRTEEAAILVGAGTYKADHPKLTARLWTGSDPQPVLLGEADAPAHWLRYGGADFSLHQMLDDLYQRKVQSLIVEGGRKVLDSFLEANLYDEVRILHGDVCYGSGLKAPTLPPDEKHPVFHYE